MLISVDNLSVTKGKHVILQDITLTIKSQDFITIIGPNGAGKSMLLKCLMGFYSPSSGKITKKPNLKIGYVPQKLHCDPTLPINVATFITLGQKIPKNHYEAIIEKTHLESLLLKQMHILSGGQMQRVLLARSLMHNPELLILDEPAQNLDIAGQIAFYKLLNKIYDMHKLAIIMVSHDLHMVMASSRQVICLYQHICCQGTPSLVSQDPEFIKLFGQDMAEMMAVYQHTHSHIHDDGCYHELP